MRYGPPRTASGRLWRAAYLGFCALLFLFLLGPIIVIMPMSLNSGEYFYYPLQGLSLQWYHDFFHNERWLHAARNSFLVGGVTTILATTLGTLASLGLVRLKSRFKSVLLLLLISPMMVPIVIVAVAVFFLYARVNLVGTFLGLILAHTALAIPFVVVTVTATLQGFNSNVVRAASSLGASPVFAFFTVTLPIILPGVISGALFAFVTSFDEIVVALFMAAPQQHTLPREIFAGIRQSITPTVTAVATVLIAISILVMALLEWLRRRNERLHGKNLG